jgi:hypothetical protein
MSFLLPSLRSCPLASRRTTTTAVTLCPSLVRLAPTFCCTLAERRRAPSTARFTTPPLLTPQNPSPAWPLTRISHRCPADVAHLDEMPDPQQRQPTCRRKGPSGCAARTRGSRARPHPRGHRRPPLAPGVRWRVARRPRGRPLLATAVGEGDALSLINMHPFSRLSFSPQAHDRGSCASLEFLTKAPAPDFRRPTPTQAEKRG